MKSRYTFKASFLDDMSAQQRSAWMRAAEEVMREQSIRFQRAMLDEQVTYILEKEEDYYTLCDLSADIGQRALQIEANTEAESLSLSSPVSGSA
jgi:acyl-CoA reductase-like NAD-dependent aldehyde dehydrogenase